MKNIVVCCIAALVIGGEFLPAISSELNSDSSDAVRLNDEGVTALKSKQWLVSFKKFEAALAKEPTMELARQNLAVAHNNYALQLCVEKKLQDSLKELHQALFLDSSNQTTVQDADWVITTLGKDPKNSADRVCLGDQATLDKDFRGAFVEYRIAASLKHEDGTIKKLDHVYKLLSENDKKFVSDKVFAESR